MARAGMIRPPPLKWKDEHDEVLRELWAKGKPGSEIGHVLRISRNAALARARRLGLPSRAAPVKYTDARLITKRGTARSATPLTVAEQPKPRPIKFWLPPVIHRPPGPCQWPTGERRPGYRFCGEAALPDRPYCALHAAKAYLRRAGAAQGARAT